MKSSYELAMERLGKSDPVAKLTDQQKARLGELDKVYAGKIAERELLVKEQLSKAVGSGDYEAIEQLERQLISDRKTLQAELEEKKEAVRKEG